jgi:hypothetical protein
MNIKIPRDTLESIFSILKKYFIVQEFTSVHKITSKEKKLYNEVAKLAIKGKGKNELFKQTL